MSHLEESILKEIEALGLVTELECHEEDYFEAAAEAADYAAYSAE